MQESSSRNQHKTPYSLLNLPNLPSPPNKPHSPSASPKSCIRISCLRLSLSIPSPLLPCKSLPIQVRKYTLHPQLSPNLPKFRFNLVNPLYVPPSFVELRWPKSIHAQRGAINVCCAEEEISTSAAFPEIVPARWDILFWLCIRGFGVGACSVDYS